MRIDDIPDFSHFLRNSKRTLIAYHPLFLVLLLCRGYLLLQAGTSL